MLFVFECIFVHSFLFIKYIDRSFCYFVIVCMPPNKIKACDYGNPTKTAPFLF